MKPITAILAASAPSSTSAIYSAYANWTFDHNPTQGLDDLTFPISLVHTPQREGYYFAQQFNFVGISDIAYTGLQPRPNQTVHAAFSTFAKDSSSSHPNCRRGANNRPGTTCFLEISGDYSHLYNITVENTGADNWQGTLVDSATGERHVIGLFTLPPGSGKLKTFRDSFVEYYRSDMPPNVPCENVPPAEVTFGNPTTTTEGAGRSRFIKWYQTQAWQCKGDIYFDVKNSSTGVTIKTGLSQAPTF
ncbi:hypothetical protein CDD81_2075 [Ophiocordyceps australis]|uniref:Uncharacterized protein n=1 Tax=Ophiocordyceps australis TaxID=1399860 RepID=A0A2C5XUN0_9HYPO|nr:hypothetical protein CDD81_2075 [Ophiocordyceps australis]